jgi:hypothetical protein
LEAFLFKQTKKEGGIKKIIENILLVKGKGTTQQQ